MQRHIFQKSSAIRKRLKKSVPPYLQRKGFKTPQKRELIFSLLCLNFKRIMREFIE